MGFFMLPLFSETNKFHNNRSFLKKIRSMANSSRMSGGSHASRDEGEQKQNKLLSLDLSAEGMNANQVSYEVLKLRSKGKHEEADGLVDVTNIRQVLDRKQCVEDVLGKNTFVVIHQL